MKTLRTDPKLGICPKIKTKKKQNTQVQCTPVQCAAVKSS